MYGLESKKVYRWTVHNGVASRQMVNCTSLSLVLSLLLPRKIVQLI